jgi:cysteine desulfurase
MYYYFDNCATTRVDDEVLQILNRYHVDTFYNPSALTNVSMMVKNDVESSRQRIAKALGVAPKELYFTSGGTEADNTAILGAVKNKKGNVVVTASEHSAVYNAVMQLKNRGIEVKLAKTTSDGHIDVDDFVSCVDENTLLACFMHVNNETGAINDVKQINALVKAKNARTITFSDGVQAVGKIPVNVKSLGVDLYTFSGHKIHCSKGTGCLYVKNGVSVNPLIVGGGQENGFRSGTEYVAGCVALATAVENAVKNVATNTQTFAIYKQILVDTLSNLDAKINCTQNVSPAILSVAFKHIKGEVLLRMLEMDGILVGTGSACSSKNKVSRVMGAIGLENQYTEGVLRISFSKYNTVEQVQALCDALAKNVNSLRKTMGVK